MIIEKSSTYEIGESQSCESLLTAERSFLCIFTSFPDSRLTKTVRSGEIGV